MTVSGLRPLNSSVRPDFGRRVVGWVIISRENCNFVDGPKSKPEGKGEEIDADHMIGTYPHLVAQRVQPNGDA
jgi:hypothetical protein